MDKLAENLRAAIGHENVLAEADELLVYECDGLPQHKYPPRAVVFPNSTEEVAEVLRVLEAENVSFSPRGAGTGLSGGALAVNRGVIVELARMRRLLKLDPENNLAIVQTGMVNAQLSRAAAPYGLHYVPDPSSQMTCTIGGNIAENAGGIHCLKYGMTVDHVLGARVVLAGGEIVDLGGAAGADLSGYDLLGVFVGSEGTFGIATEATLKLVPLPQSVRTLLADFTNVDDASRAVSAIIAAGLIPAALEMVDGETIRAVEQSVFAAGLPLDAEAALLIELDGLEAGLDAEALQAESLCRQHGARSVRLARDEKERKKFWAARKGAFGAMGRISPDLMLQDAVVPRSRLPEALAEIYRIGAKYRLLLANLFHAGDGNLHPVICFDSRDADEVMRVREAGREIMEACVRAGGTITGEHGVGLDKSDYLPLIFSEYDMDVMLRVRAAFDPAGLCNPGKIIPTPRTCSEAKAATRLASVNPSPNTQRSLHVRSRQHQANTTAPRSHSFDAGRAHSLLANVLSEENLSQGNGNALEVSPATVDEACEVLRLAARERWAVVPAGAGTWLEMGNALRDVNLFISTKRLRRIVEHEPADLVATAEAGLTLRELNTELGSHNQWLPLDPPDDGSATIGGVVATGSGGAQRFGYGMPRASVIGMRVALADGRVVKAGGRVVKNVAGYDLCKLFTGSYGTLGIILELTFKLRPRPQRTVTIAASAPEASSLFRAGRMILGARLLPVAIELVSDSVAEKLSLADRHGQSTLLIRYAGTIPAVEFQAEQTLKLLRGEGMIAQCRVFEDDAEYWRELAALPLAEANQLIWRAQVWPTDLPAFFDLAQIKGRPSERAPAFWHTGVADGRLRLMSNSAEDARKCVASLKELRQSVQRAGGALVIERAPDEIKSSLDAWGDFGNKEPLMLRVKEKLDPNNMFSPGRFGTGI
ncbi:MAG TPA: FAD-linked oxidase C-terminal domain-containing protein [Pyrinomonadaceae bacterium]|nr:FAD-linked oxidase C-terminal domain-containing protein [Pyrinomonadaceae bacterium]